MDSFCLLRQALSQTDLAVLVENCTAGFVPGRLIPDGYPGVTVSEKAVCELLAQFIPSGVEYDTSFGTGANYVYTPRGRFLGPHTDKPLYELDENFKLKPEYENRVCMVTVVACLTGQVTLRMTPFENTHEDVAMEAGDVLVVPGGMIHELLPVEADLATFACGFYCSTT